MRNPNCSSELKPGEKLDELQRNGYVIIQDKERFLLWNGRGAPFRLCQGKRTGERYWIWARERGSSPSCWKPKPGHPI